MSLSLLDEIIQSEPYVLTYTFISLDGEWRARRWASFETKDEAIEYLELHRYSENYTDFKLFHSKWEQIPIF
jgi:hypothetical protein